MIDIKHEVYVDPSLRLEFIRLLDEHDTVQNFVTEIYRKDGSRGWISTNARAVRDEAGNLIYCEGTNEDIAERQARRGIVTFTERANASISRPFAAGSRGGAYRGCSQRA